MSERGKRAAAEATLPFLEGHALVGIGTGTTVEAFIDVLGRHDLPLPAAVPSSLRTAAMLRARGIAVIEPAEAEHIPLYIDGADEVDPQLRMLKGAGGAATREKLLAQAAERFVCIAEEGKLVDALGGQPVVVEVLRVAERFVARRLRELGGAPSLRAGFRTDDDNLVLDVVGLPVADDPLGLERELAAIPGVVGNGIFAARPADMLVVGAEDGSARTMQRG